MTPTVFIGVDPGASGGLCVIEADGDVVVSPMPATDRDVWEWLDSVAEQSDGNCFAVIEKVGGFVAGNPTPGSAMFKFGRGVGVLIGCLTAAGIPFEEVTAQKWQKEFGVGGRGKTESKGQFKNRLKAVAQKLFPHVGVTLATADALLLAEYARRKYGARTKE